MLPLTALPLLGALGSQRRLVLYTASDIGHSMANMLTCIGFDLSCFVGSDRQDVNNSARPVPLGATNQRVAQISVCRLSDVPFELQ